MSTYNGASEDKNKNFVLFEKHQLSDALVGDVNALSQACDAVAAHDLLATYQSDEFTGSNGNISQRHPDGGFLITGTQLPSKEGLGSADFVHIADYVKTPAGYTANYHGTRLPSSESLMHWHLFESFPEVNAVVHVHEFNDRLYGNRELWAEFKVVETARPGVPGTIDLGEVASEAFADIRRYVILKDHVPPWDQHRTGAVVLGRTLAEAVGRALFIHEVLQP
jgi:ribulose-5-phosphate 4-epimerase/fuculose-1-phosphate aldolase